MRRRNDPLTTGSVRISESEAESRKYLLIKVPEFAVDPCGDPNDPGSPNRGHYGARMTSFLRLGAAAAAAEPGDELIDHAFGAGPGGFNGGLTVAGAQVDTAFIDDERDRGTGADEPTGAAGHGMTSAERYQWHTQHLLGRGGWRDHSDGNRITTTYGDKIEVIRGNYKLVVMGRQDDPGNAMGFDMSGNHVQDFAQATMPGASVTVEWIQNGYVPDAPVEIEPGESYVGGAWLLINSTERVYQYSRNAGHFREQQWGEKLESYVGSENPERIGTSDDAGYQGHPSASDIASDHAVLSDDDLVAKLRPSSKGLPRGNPHVIDRTWASKIEEYTGSAAKRVPSIHSETWAEDVIELTDVLHGTASNTRIGGGVAEATSIGGASVSQTTIGGAQVDSTIVGAAAVELAISGTHTSLTITGVETGVTLCPLTNEVTIGTTNSLSIGDKSELNLGNTVALEVGNKVELFVGNTAALTFSNAFELVMGNAMEVFLGTKLEFAAGAVMSLAAEGTNIELSDTDLAALGKKLGFKLENG